MKHFVRALMLLTLGLVLLCPAVVAQDALSAILPSPESTRVGSQLIYVFEDGASRSGVGPFVSYLTVTNTNISTGVQVHFQFYSLSGQSSACTELFDFTDTLTLGKNLVINPVAVKKAGNVIGSATNGRYVLTITALTNIPAALPADLRAYSFNYLTGQVWVSDINQSATYMTNAAARMAVDQFGAPLGNTILITGTTSAQPSGGPGASPDTANTHFQYFRPRWLVVNSFFAPVTVQQATAAIPFGNRLTMMSFTDQYTNTQNMYKIISASTALNSFVWDTNENAYSVPPKTVSCVTEWTIAPNATASSFADFLSPSGDAAVSATGGWLRMQVANMTDVTSIFGWFSQDLASFGGGDFLVGIGRQGQAGTWYTVFGVTQVNTPGATQVTSANLSNASSVASQVNTFP